MKTEIDEETVLRNNSPSITEYSLLSPQFSPTTSVKELFTAKQFPVRARKAGETILKISEPRLSKANLQPLDEEMQNMQSTSTLKKSDLIPISQKMVLSNRR